ncbi:MAG: hypothetical protein ABIT83_26230 [Massilia sp.]
MNFNSPLSRAIKRAFCMLPLLITMHAVPAPAHAAPAAEATIDVCENAASGQWRYSGVVAVTDDRAASGTALGLDQRIQNKVVGTDYLDVYATSGASAVSASDDPRTKVLAYSVEAAPLVLGTLRALSRVVITDLSGAPAQTVSASAPVVEAICGCPVIKGCVRTQGYWGNKPGVVWPAAYSRTAMFFSSGLTWQQVLDTPPRGSAYLILAHQYIAAVLNMAAGASAPSSVQTVIDNAKVFFLGGTTPASCTPGACAPQISWAGMLDTYNNGQYPGAPKHCPD